MTSRKARGPAPRYVTDPVTHKPIVGLYFDKGTKQHYTRRDGRKTYFGRDLISAVAKFHEWQLHAEGKKMLLAETRGILGEGVDPADAVAEGWMKPEDQHKTVPWPTPVDADSFWREARRLLHQDPVEFARRIGEPRIARLDDLQPLETSLKFAEVWELYTSRRKKLTTHWQRKQQSYWDTFAQATGKKTLAEVTQDDVRRYDGVLARTGKGRSATWRNHRIGAVRSILRAVLKMKRDTARVRKVLEFTDVLEYDQKAKLDPQPIERDDLHAILEAADVRWRAAILLSLNAGLYPSELAAVLKDELDLDKGTFVSRRSKTGIVRVACLWGRTVEALRDYLDEQPHDLDTLLRNAQGSEYDANHICRHWRSLVKRAGCEGVQFAQLRDGTLSAAADATMDEVRMLAGHAVGGISDAYIRRRPQLVADACAAVEQFYFGKEGGK